MTGTLIDIRRVLFLADELAKNNYGVDVRLHNNILWVVQDGGSLSNERRGTPLKQVAHWLRNLQQV